MARLEVDRTLTLPGLRVRSVGVRAQVDAGPAAERAAVGAGAPGMAAQLVAADVPEQGARALADALGAQDVRVVAAARLGSVAVAGDAAAPPFEAAAAPAVELAVPAPAPGEGQVVLAADATGVVSWHLPAPATSAESVGAPAEQVVHVPVARPAGLGGADGGPQELGPVTAGAATVLTVLRYPLAAVAQRAVALWEERARPYRLRPLDALVAGGTAGDLEGDGLHRLADGPTLVLLHGTFSTAGSTFSRLVRDVAFVDEVRRRYGTRVVAFDHPSLHHDPVENARRLLRGFDPGAHLELDVVAHSRGGLVARALADPRTAEGIGHRPPRVRTAVHVATPNAGTVLADPAHWRTLLDTVTNLAVLLPDDTVTAVLVAVVETVKQLGTGALGGLDGLRAMAPGSDVLTSGLRPGPHPGRVFTVASDHGPAGASPAVQALDRLVDPFFGEGNDLVVPTAGVAAGTGAVESLVVERTPSLAHTTYFRDAQLRRTLLGWLPA